MSHSGELPEAISHTRTHSPEGRNACLGNPKPTPSFRVPVILAPWLLMVLAGVPWLLPQ